MLPITSIEPTTMNTLLKEFALAIEEAASALDAIDEETSLEIPGPGRWTRREILGHLIDSAANNHARFVRGQIERDYSGPGYLPDAWVETQCYRQEPWSELVGLWTWYNRHLLHVVAHARPDALSHPIVIDGAEPVTLAFVMEDYVRHLRHHLAQILDAPL
jgi:hypothetical protein